MITTAATCATVTWAGRELLLHPEGVVIDPGSRTLFAADIHLGKPASFRARGVAAPDGPVAFDLARLSSVVRNFAIEHVIMLGDLFHDAEGTNAATLSALAEWRAEHEGVHCTLVRGNHDLRSGDPPAACRITCVDPPWSHAGLACVHEPDVIPPGNTPRLAGHVHPVVRLQTPGRRRGGHARLRCFAMTDDLLLLPAFGSFTGGARLSPSPDTRIFVLTPGQTVEVPCGVVQPNRTPKNSPRRSRGQASL